jgi:hypothetical protein
MTGRDRAFLRGQLAAVGIVLDPPRTAVCASASSTPRAPVDRDAVRAILVSRGAPAADLGWLVDSCRSLDDARRYVPTRQLVTSRRAWCHACGDFADQDARGCIACRAITDEESPIDSIRVDNTAVKP